MSRHDPDLELAGMIVEYLNQLLLADRPAIAALIANRVPCNVNLAHHPTVQAGIQHGGYNVGMLGILNGLCGIHESGNGPICAVFDNAESENHFPSLLRFDLTEGEKR